MDECIDFINEIKEEKIFMISSGTLGKTTVPIVHDQPQISTIYIFCGDETRHEKWVQNWPKIKGVFTDITPICEALKQAAEECDQNMVSISLVKVTDEVTNQNLNELDPSFMYTQILKEILLLIDFEEGHIHKFLTYCREQFDGNITQLKNIDKLETEYHLYQPIWWYTYQCFLYPMLNRALRTMEVDLIVKMGFFIRDLHNHIVTLHSEQYTGQNSSNSFIVYRGQGLSQENFEEMVKTKGGLLAFNNFLSTSKIRDVSLNFARRTMATSSLVGILFILTIDPLMSSTPFADVRDVSAYQTEEEILFSMHSVFRIGNIKQIDGNSRLWQVDLTLTGDNDPHLHALTERIREEIAGSTGWLRLGNLMIQLAQYDEAEDLHKILLAQTNDEREKGDIYYQLGCVKNGQGKYTEAITSYENSLQIREKIYTTQHSDVAECYNDIGVVHKNMGKYSKAFSYYEKALEIRQKTLPLNHPDLATSYSNIGTVYDKMGDYSKAFSYYEKALEIYQKTLPPNHPSLADAYGSLGTMYHKMGDYSKALSYYEKTLEIKQKTLPPNHPSLATSYNNIGTMYDKMGDYSKAFSYYEKDLEICQKARPPNHPDLAISYGNIGALYNTMGKYSEALSCYEKSLEIDQKTLPPDHPDLATSYNNIGAVYNNMGEYSKALSYYEKALEIRQKTLPANHPHLAQSYNNIGLVYDNMGEYSKALSYYENALEIYQKTLPENHPDLATSYNNIGWVYRNMGDYSKALSFYERALDIWQRSLPPNHPHLQSVRESIETMKKKL
jgi:tetratricopeptide (TPR) repeat protein